MDENLIWYSLKCLNEINTSLQGGKAQKDCQSNLESFYLEVELFPKEKYEGDCLMDTIHCFWWIKLLPFIKPISDNRIGRDE